ncbi:MAG: putative transposase [Gammaproteobacteria bacterium]|jgi:putative transposase
MCDRIEDGRAIRLLTIIDDFIREGPAIDVGFSLTAEHLIRTLERVIEWRGTPQVVRCDNGPGYVSDALKR